MPVGVLHNIVVFKVGQLLYLRLSAQLITSVLPMHIDVARFVNGYCSRVGGKG